MALGTAARKSPASPQRHSRIAHDALREPEKIVVALFNRLHMRTNRPIGWFKGEHGLARFHSKRHQAAIVLEQSQIVRILRNRWNLAANFFTQYRLPVYRGDTLRPTLIGFDRAGIANAVLHDDIPHRLQGVFGHEQIMGRLGKKVAPDITPVLQSRPNGRPATAVSRVRSPAAIQ